MLGSQALETGIGLAVMFFVISTAASVVVEAISRLLKHRAQHLESALLALLDGTKNVQGNVFTDFWATVRPGGLTAFKALRAERFAALDAFKKTSAYDATLAGSGYSAFRWATRQKPSYLSAKTFADGVIELVVDHLQDPAKGFATLPAGIRDRLVAIVREANADLVAVRAHLERQYDETMERVGAAYKRWAGLVLFVVGLGLAILANASTVTVAEQLWQDSTTRQAVVDAASGLSADAAAGDKITSVAQATDTLTSLHLPIGWTRAAKDAWAAGLGQNWPTVAGWLVTAVLVLLGGPFWFDVLTRLVSLRSGGDKPPAASADPMSAIAELTRRTALQVTAAPPAPPAPPAPSAKAADLERTKRVLAAALGITNPA